MCSGYNWSVGCLQGKGSMGLQKMVSEFLDGEVW